ncbi:helix-turn-helix domain-containing protein [Rhodobacter sphaeroides]|nr:helix-turn-helix domain-containing protein [Cereibacter sphaeroides]
MASYLTIHGISQRAFARAVNVDPSMISRLLRGAVRPGLELAVAIERETRGAVLASSWIPENQLGTKEGAA